MPAVPDRVSIRRGNLDSTKRQEHSRFDGRRQDRDGLDLEFRLLRLILALTNRLIEHRGGGRGQIQRLHSPLHRQPQ